jgi:hypothetical protein
VDCSPPLACFFPLYAPQRALIATIPMPRPDDSWAQARPIAANIDRATGPQPKTRSRHFDAIGASFSS